MGNECLNRPNWIVRNGNLDVNRKRLVVARDAMGIKLIYYRIADGQLTFGSAIRPILASSDSRPSVSPVALHLFLRCRYTPSPLTLYEGVRKLATGTMLVWGEGKWHDKRWSNRVRARSLTGSSGNE